MAKIAAPVVRQWCEECQEFTASRVYYGSMVCVQCPDPPDEDDDDDDWPEVDG